MSGAAKPVAIIMGSQSDWAVMRRAAETLEALGVGYEARIVSAHRTPDRLAAFAKGAKAAGFKVIIAGAGGAAHLPGMTAAFTALPVFGVPVPSKALSAMDSLLSIVQMPAGVPVGDARDRRSRARSTRRCSPQPCWRWPTKRWRRGSRRGGPRARPRSPSGRK